MLVAWVVHADQDGTESSAVNGQQLRRGTTFGARTGVLLLEAWRRGAPGGRFVGKALAGRPGRVVRCAMRPRIEGTRFGSVTIDGTVYEHDVLIRLGGKVEKRKKKLSKAVYGTSHTISLVEARHVYQKGAARLLIGAGQYDTVAL
jgi:hypothetical protein